MKKAKVQRILKKKILKIENSKQKNKFYFYFYNNPFCILYYIFFLFFSIFFNLSIFYHNQISNSYLWSVINYILTFSKISVTLLLFSVCVCTETCKTLEGNCFSRSRFGNTFNCFSRGQLYTRGLCCGTLSHRLC